MKTYHQEKAAQTVHQARGPMSVDGRGNVSQELTPALYAHTCARYNKVENEFPNDTNEEEQLTEGSEPYFPLPAFPQDDIWPELLEKIISYSKKTK